MLLKAALECECGLADIRAFIDAVGDAVDKNGVSCMPTVQIS